jgi:hypothetical protein
VKLFIYLHALNTTSGVRCNCGFAGINNNETSALYSAAQIDITAKAGTQYRLLVPMCLGGKRVLGGRLLVPMCLGAKRDLCSSAWSTRPPISFETLIRTPERGEASRGTVLLRFRLLGIIQERACCSSTGAAVAFRVYLALTLTTQQRGPKKSIRCLILARVLQAVRSGPARQWTVLSAHFPPPACPSPAIRVWPSESSHLSRQRLGAQKMQRCETESAGRSCGGGKHGTAGSPLAPSPR